MLTQNMGLLDRVGYSSSADEWIEVPLTSLAALMA
jgi:hypothetical protein